MPSLNSYGKIDAATMVFYLPILGISLVLVFRNGFRRDAGWIFLCIFSLGTFCVLYAGIPSLTTIIFSSNYWRGIDGSSGIDRTGEHNVIHHRIYPRIRWTLPPLTGNLRFSQYHVCQPKLIPSVRCN